MKAKTKPPVKLPRSTVLPPHTFPNPYWKARIICRTRQEAREIVRIRGMSEKEIRHLVWNLTPTNADVAKGIYSRINLMNAILQALHLIP